MKESILEEIKKDREICDQSKMFQYLSLDHGAIWANQYLTRNLLSSNPLASTYQIAVNDYRQDLIRCLSIVTKLIERFDIETEEGLKILANTEQQKEVA